MSVDWKGDELKDRLEKAAKLGLSKTASDCIKTAKGLVHKKTTTLQGSIRMDPPERVGAQIVLQWGSFDVDYAIYQEKLPPEKGGKAYLRPSADQHYSQLAGHIQRAFEGKL